VRRYLRLYAQFLRMTFARTVQFRLDFVSRVLMDTLWYGHYLGFFAVLSTQAPSVGGWDAAQLRVFTGALFVVDALQMTFVANGLWNLPLLVNTGALDYYLVRPVSTLFFVTGREISASSAVNLLMAIGVLVWSLATYPHPIAWTSLLVFLAMLPVGLLLHAGLHLLFLTPQLWTQSPKGLRDLFWATLDYGLRPDGIYRGYLRRFLTTVLPLACIVSFPTRVLFEGPRPGLVLNVLAATVGVWVVVGTLWRRGLRAYGSASS
jgi:ABC-2 type transport system permease protein